MEKIDSLLNPSNIRVKIFGGERPLSNDSGAMLVEAMIYFAIVILIAGQVVPELMKALERAEVDNMRAAVTTLSGQIEMDHGYTGTVKYTTGELADAEEKIKVPGDMTLTTGLLTSTNGKSTASKDAGYFITAVSDNSANYCVRYSSIGFDSAADGSDNFTKFQVLAKDSCGTW